MLGASSAPEVILLTESGNPDEAEMAIRNGAWDYIERPLTAKTMTLTLTCAPISSKESRPAPSSGVRRRMVSKDIVGSSASMKACVDLLAMAGNGNANVLISGETGTGKELFAWAIHKNSSRVGKRFVVVDCASLPETLVESILFGYHKGAFTGAHASNEGLIKES